ncbi:probable G-protein coupled receptor 148 [Paramormyrops kingsleyae]|uniref:probable G-protein coupled receptor 148 n=1 Tax=Paramormyrops kingsleyae TaxID=1676925 RepID=UPI003B96EA58
MFSGALGRSSLPFPQQLGTRTWAGRVAPHDPDRGPTMHNSTWLEGVRHWNMDLFLIPAVTLTALTLAADSLLLACILCSRALRRETRYLLLANALAADTVFLAFNMAVVSCNALGAGVPRLACELLTAASITAYCCGILSITLMVLDTYVAVRWPLHYQRLLPPARTRRILLGTWILSTMYPASQVIVMEVTQSAVPWDHTPCLFVTLLGSASGNMMVGIHMYCSVGVILCGSLIVYFYARLYVITRTSGIWRSRYSRARVTLLAHATMLLLHFGPGLVFSVELTLFQSRTLGHRQLLLMNMLNTHLLTLLPRAGAPYLYGLRYRDISDTLLNLVRGRSQVTVA